MSRVSRRVGTKTKTITLGAKKGGLKARYPRTWKKDGKFQPTSLNPRFQKEKPA